LLPTEFGRNLIFALLAAISDTPFGNDCSVSE
jgi:hypothetical protein